MSRQSCVICAWRENCNKRFCVSDSGARCPDFSRDIRIKQSEEEKEDQEKESEEKNKK